MALTLDQQDRLIRRDWSFRTILLGRDLGLWRGRVTGLSAPYEVSILYVRRHFQDGFEYGHPYFPQVKVREPLLSRRPEAPEVPIPHVYDEGLTVRPPLCLFDPALQGWSAERPIAATTIPWIADWLRFYEAWQATGIWTGGGRQHRLEPWPQLTGLSPSRRGLARAAGLVGTNASRALLAAAAIPEVRFPAPRWRWADVPSDEWCDRAPSVSLTRHSPARDRIAA